MSYRKEKYSVKIRLWVSGASPEYDSIVGIEAVKKEKDRDVTFFTPIALPEEEAFFVPFVSRLTGIAECDLNAAPTCAEAFKALKAFMGEDALPMFTSDTDKAFYAKTFSRLFEASGQEENPLAGKNCVFTGGLSRYSRGFACILLKEAGGGMKNQVNQKTDYLICGRKGNARSRKRMEAERLQKCGSKIQILSEEVFYAMLEKSLKSLGKEAYL